MYVLAKFQLRFLKAFEVTALQSSSNRKIELYSKYRENKLQALTNINLLMYRLMFTVNYKEWIYSNLFLLLPFITTNKVEIHEETSIANNRLDVTWINSHTLQFL